MKLYSYDGFGVTSVTDEAVSMKLEDDEALMLFMAAWWWFYGGRKIGGGCFKVVMMELR